MNFRQPHQDTVADALQQAKMPRETVAKIMTLLVHLFAQGDNVNEILDAIDKTYIQAKAVKPAKKEPAAA